MLRIMMLAHGDEWMQAKSCTALRQAKCVTIKAFESKAFE